MGSLEKIITSKQWVIITFCISAFSLINIGDDFLNLGIKWARFFHYIPDAINAVRNALLALFNFISPIDIPAYVPDIFIFASMYVAGVLAYSYIEPTLVEDMGLESRRELAKNALFLEALFFTSASVLGPLFMPAALIYGSMYLREQYKKDQLAQAFYRAQIATELAAMPLGISVGIALVILLLNYALFMPIFGAIL